MKNVHKAVQMFQEVRLQKVIQENAEDIDHDGVELSIQGSDIDEDVNNDMVASEPVEISSSEDEDECTEHTTKKVLSKVVKVSKENGTGKTANNDKFDKFSQGRNNPDFREFLREMVGESTTTSKQSVGKHDKKSQSKPKNSKEKNTGIVGTESDGVEISTGVHDIAKSNNTPI